MSKSVLVIDTPERCIDCEIGQNYSKDYRNLCFLPDCRKVNVRRRSRINP